MTLHRCAWCGTDPLYVAYHDEEWGVPEYDPRALWEKLVLDGFQAGLAWITILRKREGMRDAFDGLRRFSEFQKSTGAARNILADRLRLLVEHDIFAVAPASDGTAYQEYVLTPKGEALFPLVVGLRQWGEAHLFARGEKHSVLIDKQTKQPLAPMLPMARDGHAIQAAETEVRKVASKARG